MNLLNMKCVLSVLFMLSSLVVYAQGDDTTISQWKGLHSEQERVAQKTLDMFPSTWQEFMELYGWDDTKMAGKPFYNRQLNDAEYLYNNRQLINYDLFIQKVIGLASEAIWDADHVKFFQKVVQKMLEYDWAHCYPYIEQLDENRAKVFWRFVLASPAMGNMTSLREKYVKSANSEHYKYAHLINEAFEYNVVQFKH